MTLNTNCTSSKKRRSLSKKEKSIKRLDVRPRLSAKILFRVLMCWIILVSLGFIAYWKKGPSSVILRAEEKMRKQQKQRQSFAADVTSSIPNDAQFKYIMSQEFTVDEVQLWDPPDSRIAALVSHACQEMYCHKSLKVVGRTLRATAPIEVGEKLYEIPRSMQIWDLDAYRDPFVRKHLFKASHKISGNRMGTEAFLTAYLALEIKKAELNPSNFDPLRLLYFDSLPTYEEFQAYHPLLADKNVVGEILGPRSMGHSILQGYRNMVRSEYNGFIAASSEFANTISPNEYARARLAVLTRALNVGPPGPEEVMAAAFVGDEFRDQDLFLDELYSYYDLINVNLTEAGGQGCIAMIPIADLFNHHPNNNIELQYKRMQTHQETKTKSGRSFVVSSTNRVIEPYSEPMVSRVILQ